MHGWELSSAKAIGQQDEPMTEGPAAHAYSNFRAAVDASPPRQMTNLGRYARWIPSLGASVILLAESLPLSSAILHVRNPSLQRYG